MAKRVITFGEIMLRLNPMSYLRFVQAESFEATYAGGEANVAVSLDSLANEGVLFTNFYANSFRTDRGLIAVLSGYPAQHVKPLYMIRIVTTKSYGRLCGKGSTNTWGRHFHMTT